MGPSWYWMPDIIEGFFTDFDCKASDFLNLVSLILSLRWFFQKKNISS
jgi:phytoene desaturase